ncbi:hypothetical protein GGH93_002365 [Coemansia aciculifera]|nr:hypothetical protein GGH93_002365 [Coemansia aciculifera]
MLRVLVAVALQQLSSTPYDGCAFPLVRTLTFDIRFVQGCQSDDKINSPPGSEANVLAFVQRVKEMVPQVSEVYQEIRHNNSRSFEDYDSRTIFLISQLYRIVETTVISYGNRDLVMNLDLALIGNLTSVESATAWQDNRMLVLIRQSSQSLQTLHISAYGTADISELVRGTGDDGKCVEYPHLHTLDLCGFDTGQNPSFNGAVPFPNLRRLILLTGYPFGDDVVFRGNGAILESLKVALYPETVALLKKHTVFTCTSHPKLRVCICSGANNQSMAFDTASTCVKFVLSITPAASVRVFPGLSEFGEDPMPALSLFGDYTSIQRLSMYDVQLSLWDALTFIKSLPLLSDLHAMFPTLDEPPRGVSEADLPNYVTLNFAPMGKRFRCWDFTYSSWEEPDGTARCILLLALACPNFDYAVMDAEHREPFMEEMRSQIDKPWFNLHAPRLQRLLYDD